MSSSCKINYSSCMLVFLSCTLLRFALPIKGVLIGGGGGGGPFDG